MSRERTSAAPLSSEALDVRLTTRTTDVAGCVVELHVDGSVVLVVDGERLFRFASLDALLTQYDLVQNAHDGAANDAAAARDELVAAELAATIAINAIEVRTRAEKALIDTRVAVAIERVRQARSRICEQR